MLWVTAIARTIDTQQQEPLMAGKSERVNALSCFATVINVGKFLELIGVPFRLSFCIPAKSQSGNFPLSLIVDMQVAGSARIPSFACLL